MAEFPARTIVARVDYRQIAALSRRRNGFNSRREYQYCWIEADSVQRRPVKSEFCGFKSHRSSHLCARTQPVQRLA